MPQKKYIDATTINQLFHEEQRKRRFPSWQVISAVILVVFGFFFLFNAPALNQQVRYWWENDIQASQTAQLVPTIPVVEPTDQSNQPQAKPSSTTLPAASQTADFTSLSNNTIWIPKLGIKAPVLWDITSSGDITSDILTALQKGVVRYPQTALPDQVGNVFLTGHSSNYWWEKGSYKTIFALLDRLVVGDMIYIKYDSQVYTYRVNGQKVVKPSETSVLERTEHATLSLMTCTPVGTNLLRRVVTAQLISPTTLTKKQPTSPAESLIYAVR